MARFRVRTFDAGQGTAVTRTVEAESAEAVLRLAETSGQTVLSVSPVRKLWHSAPPALDIGLFCEELATLLRAGLNVLEALEALADQEDSSAAPIYGELASELKEGRSLSLVLGRRTQVFPAVLVASIRAAERTGRIADALDQYGSFHVAMQELRRKLISAAVYPSLILGFGGAVAVFLLLVVIPRFASVYSGHGAKPGLVSQLLLVLSQHMASYRGVWFLLLCAVAVALVYGWQRGAVQRWGLTQVLKIAAVRRWARLLQMGEIYRSLGMLLRGGFAVVEALRLCQDSPAEPALCVSLGRATSQVNEGALLSMAFSREGLADSVALRLLNAGEQSGELAAALDAIANDYARRVERRLNYAMRLIEPVVMILVGALVGGLVLLMYMPVFDLAGALT